MSNIDLYASADHRNILLEDFDTGEGIQANQHLVIHGKEAVLLDPGGHKVYKNVLASTFKELKGAKLKHLFLSHQDPDIVAAVNGWLMTTEATAWLSRLWKRFVAHFGVDRLVIDRLKDIPDEGMCLPLDGLDLLILPAHFLHSSGNFHLYDPVSKILYSGDLGASVGQDYREVPDFDAHIEYMHGFHRRYMPSKPALQKWCRLARQLDIEIIAPQHGALFRGKPMVERFLSWCDDLQCGAEAMPEYELPR